MVIDQLASLTDTSALALHARLVCPLAATSVRSLPRGHDSGALHGAVLPLIVRGMPHVCGDVALTRWRRQ